jgi:hypothetical protein
MGSFCLNIKEPSVKNLLHKVGNKQINSIAEAINNDTNVLIEIDGKIVKSNLYSDIRKVSENAEQAFDKYLEYYSTDYLNKHNWFEKLDNLDANGEPIYGRDYNNINEAINHIDDKIKYVSSIILAYNNRLRKNPTDNLLKDIVKKLGKLNFADYDNYTIAKALYVDHRYNRSTIDYYKELLFGKNGYNNKVIAKDIVGNIELETQFGKDMMMFNTFFTGLQLVSNLEKIKGDTLTESEIELNNSIDNLQNLLKELNELKIVSDRLLSDYFRKVTTDITTNPDILLEFRDVFDIQDDESKIQYMLDAMADTNHSFVANFVKRFIAKRSILSKDIKAEQRAFKEKMKSFKDAGYSIESLIDKRYDDGRMISEFDNTYRDVIKDYTTRLSDIIETKGKYSKEYYDLEKEYNNWRLENMLLGNKEDGRIKEEVTVNRMKVNDILYSNFEARRKVEELNEKKRNILAMYDNEFDIYELSKQDLDTLLKLERERSALANIYNLDHTEKTGVELQIAKTIDSYNKAFAEHLEKYYDSMPIDSFKDMLEEAIKKNDTDWLSKNTKTVHKDSFWEDLEKHSAILGHERTEKEYNAAKKLYRDSNGVIDGRLVPKNMVLKILNDHKARYENENPIVIQERIAKGIKIPKKDYVVTDEYKKRLENSGTTKTNDKELAKLVNNVNNILFKYDENGVINYSNVSLNDIKKLNNLFDQISYANTTVVKDQERLLFDEWYRDNHEFIIDTQAFEKSRSIAESKGIEYYNDWLQANTAFKLEDSFYEEVEALKYEYGIDPADATTKEEVKITKIDYDAIRRLVKGTSQGGDFSKLPATLKAAIAKKEGRKHGVNANYTLNSMMYDLYSHNPEDLTDKAKATERLIRAKKLSFNAAIESESKNAEVKSKITLFKQQYNALFKTEKIAEYNELLKLHGKNSEWYYNNHTLSLEGNIIPVAIWTNSIPVDSAHYTKNAPKGSIWGYSTLTSDKYKDVEKSKSRKWMNDNIKNSPTEYYFEAFNKNRDNMSEEDFNTWYDENHVINPYTGVVEPINIWTNFQSSNPNYINSHEPKNHLRQSKLKDQYRDKSETDPYREVFGYQIPKKTSKYNNPEYATIKENPLYQYINELLSDLTKHYDKETLIDHGYLPIAKKDDPWIKKLVKNIGWYAYNNDEVVGENKEAIKLYNLPLSGKLSKEKLLPYPKKEDFNTDVEYAEAYKEIKAKNDELRTINDEYHKANLDRDYESILELFISTARDNKFSRDFESEFRLAMKQVENLKFVKRKNSMQRMFNKADQDILESQGIQDGETFATISGTESNVLQHFQMFFKMIFEKDFEADEGNFTKAARVLQNYTSAKGMWINGVGAFNNIAYGNTQIALESFSGYFFNSKDRILAEKDFWESVIPTLSNISKDKSTNKIEAAVKFYDIIESQDETAITSSSQMDKSMRKYLLSSSPMYILHHLGEYYMQNITLLGMLRSHRIIDGKIKSIHDYNFDFRYKIVKNILGDNSKDFDKFIKSNKNKDKYLDGKSDLIRDFVLQGTSDIKVEYLTELDRLGKERSEAFNSYPSLFEVSNVNDKGLYKLDANVSDMEIALFKGKVISVNQKIHGIYSKMGANTIQHYAVGRLVMQFKKWLRPGWNKRFGSRFGKAYWNEARGEQDKGMYISTFQLLFKPFIDNINSDVFKSDKELTVSKAFMNILNDYRNYMSNVKLYWNTLTETDKANVKRTITEMVVFGTLVVLAAAVRKLGDDDELTGKNLAYSLYVLDRLKSETRAYDPLFGWFNESKKLLKDPFAAMSSVESYIKLMYTLMFEYDVDYKGGAYNKQRKLHVQLKKMIPVLNKYQRYENIESFSGYYKLFNN